MQPSRYVNLLLGCEGGGLVKGHVWHRCIFCKKKIQYLEVVK